MNVTGKVMEPLVSTTALEAELRAVTADKARLITKLEELQGEVRRLRLECSETALATSRETTLERENRFLRDNFLLHIENEQRRHQQQKQCEVNQTARNPPDRGVDSLRLPSLQLLRAVREVFAPGRIVLDEYMNNGNTSSSVVIEYSEEYIIVRGEWMNRMVFMVSLLHAVLAHLETASLGSVECPLFSSASPSRRVEDGSHANDEENGEETSKARIRALRQAFNVERVARERAEIAQRDAEHRRALAEAALRSERNRIELSLSEKELEIKPSKPFPSSPVVSAPGAVKVTPSKAGVCDEDGAPQDQLLLQQQREIDLLRLERQRLTHQLQSSTPSAQQQCGHQCARVEAAAAALCRDALTHFEGRSPRGGFGDCGDCGEEAAAACRLRAALSCGGLAEQLCCAAALLAAERRAHRAAVEFAQNERDAALSARRSAAKPKAKPHSKQLSPRAPCQECGALRQELHRCLGDMRRMRDALQSASAAQAALQREAKGHAQRASDAAEALRSAELRHTREFIAARQREEALERQMHLIRASTLQMQLPLQRQAQAQAQAASPGQVPTQTAHTVLQGAVGAKGTAADFLVTTPSRHTSTNNSIDQGCPSAVLRKENFVRDLDSIYLR